MSFHLIFEFFWPEIRKKIKVGKIRKYDEETQYFEKKNAFILLKGSIIKIGGRKISGGSRVSCLLIQLHLNTKTPASTTRIGYHEYHISFKITGEFARSVTDQFQLPLTGPC